MALQQAHTETSELEDSRPARKEDSIPVYDENAAEESAKDLTDPQHENEPKNSVRDADPSSDAAARKKRRKPRKHRYETLEKDIVVPPFNDWEKNPEAADKYTGVFQIVSDSRRTPGTPIKIPAEAETKQDNTEGKGCRCLSWLFK